jgi:hypothetical protein
VFDKEDKKIYSKKQKNSVNTSRKYVLVPILLWYGGVGGTPELPLCVFAFEIYFFK